MQKLPNLPMPRKNPYLIHTNLYNTPGTADEVVKQLADSGQVEAAKILKSQFDYQRGNVDVIYEEVQYFLKAHSGLNAVVSAGMLLSKCAMWRGDINLWRQARQHIYEAPYKDEKERQVLLCWLAINDSAIHDTTEFPEWFKYGIFDYLPADSYSSARFFYAKYLYIRAHDLASGKLSFENVKGIGLMRTIPFIVEPMISQAKMERTIIPEIYLRLMVASAYHNIGEDNKAISHIDRAIELSLPDRLYAALSEYRGHLDTLLDERLALVDTNILKTVRELHKKAILGWTKFHNIVLERNVSTLLTTREREVAKLAAFGLSNSEISKRMNIAISSVKTHILSAMNKVGVDKRTELGLYI